MGGGEDVSMVIFEVDMFGVDEEGGPVGVERAEVKFGGLKVEIVEQLVQLWGGVTQAQALQGALGGGKAFGLEKDVSEELVKGVREMALIFGQDRRVKAFARAGQLDLDGSGAQMDGARGREAVGAVFGILVQMDLALGLQGGVEELGKALQEEFFELFFGQEEVQELVPGDGVGQVSDAILQFGDQRGSIHME